MSNNINGYFDKEICNGCGKCCIQGGCGYPPSDFEKMSYGFLKSKLEEETIAIEAIIKPSFVDGEYTWYPLLAMRSRNIDRGIVDLISYRTPCVLLGEKGCTYEDDERPSLGRYLKPSENGDCKQMLEREKIEQAWIKHQDTLHGLVKYFSGKSVEENILKDISDLKKQMKAKYPKSFRIDFKGNLHYVPSNDQLDDETNDLYSVIELTQNAKLKKRKIK